MALAEWQITVGLVAVLLSLQLHTARAQPGFLSIDCGSTKAYNGTGQIQWVPDSPYITTGLNSDNVIVQGFTEAYQTVRYFPENRGKSCYVLPAAVNETYLIRTTFLYGPYDSGSRTPQFQLDIDTYNLGVVYPTTPTELIVYETTMVATAANVYVCLRPVTPGVDVPFINMLEMRDLGRETLYPKANDGYYLSTMYRYNFGYDTLLRFPDDPFDRLWYGYGTEAPKRIVNTTNTVDRGTSRDQAPMRVLQTAQTWLLSETFTFDFNVSAGIYMTYWWFAEIDPQAANKTLSIVVGVDGTPQAPITIVNATGGMYTAQEWGYSSVNLSSTSALTFSATNDSTIGPILNAIEVYLVSTPIQPRTYDSDAAAIETIKSELNLADWTGDPCLTIPYDWIACSAGPAPRITSLKLAGYNLTGSIPPAIAKLSALTILWLENNALNGTIPDLSALTGLTQLHLQNNNFSGPFPQWVAKLTSLTELYINGNNLSGHVPSSLIGQVGLDFRYQPGNSGLCTGNATVCVSLPPESSSAPSKTSSNIGLIVGCAVGGAAVAAVVLFLIIFFACCRRRKPGATPATKIPDAIPHTTGGSSGVEMLSASGNQAKPYTLKAVKAATNDFNNLIGEGGFGPVYKGVLPNGKEVAVKRGSSSNRHGAAEFSNEVDLLSRVHHRNLVSLVGYCQEGREQILMYEYMPNGDLRKHLHGGPNNSGVPKTHLPWKKRLQIALDAAQGLEYLHTGCSPSIIHRDVKTSNILLANNMVAKVADFGLSKLTTNENFQHVSTEVKGTAGYLDPEYLTTRHLTDKSDVYSFGVVLLEFICGRMPIDRSRFDANQTILTEWVRRQLEAGNITEIVDPSLETNYNTESMWKVAEIGMVCVEPKSKHRPTMTTVVRDLRDAIALEDGEAQVDYSIASGSSEPRSAHTANMHKNAYYTDNVEVSQTFSQDSIALDRPAPR